MLGAATEKLREPKGVRTRETTNKLHLCPILSTRANPRSRVNPGLARGLEKVVFYQHQNSG